MQARILSAVAAIALPATPALADSREDASRYLALGSETEAPRGYVEMCTYQREWCAERRAPVSDPAEAATAKPATATPGGSAFPVILSFNFSIPAEALEKAGKAATLEAKMSKIAWAQPIAAMHAVPMALGDSASAASRVAAEARLSARAEGGALDLLKTVNRRVNGAVLQRRDAQIFGQGELWRRAGIGSGAVGDCEDIAIEKRLQLVAEGFPADKLAFAVVFRRDVGLHTVLVARTGRGDVVLDSLDPYVSDWTKARYSWISVQSMDDPQRWFAPGARRAA